MSFAPEHPKRQAELPDQAADEPSDNLAAVLDSCSIEGLEAVFRIIKACSQDGQPARSTNLPVEVLEAVLRLVQIRQARTK